MSDFPLLAITDAATCPRPLLAQIERLATLTTRRPQAIVLRAKNLPADEYRTLAQAAQNICNTHKLPLILHSDWQLANALQIDGLHLPLALLRQLPQAERKHFAWLSTSVHSVCEAQEAESLGANVLIAGHIYATQCKAGLPPRGVEFLQAVCSSVKVPVYAIGGIGFDSTQHAELAAHGARGACIMSAYMRL